MPLLITRRRLAALRAEIERLREHAAETEHEVLDLGRSAGRLARRATLAEAAAANVSSAYRTGRRDLVAQVGRLEEQVRMLTRDRDGLREQLDHALYGDAELELIANGATAAKGDAA